MRLSKFSLSVLFLALSFSFAFSQYLHVLDTAPKDVKTSYITRDSAGQTVVVNNSNASDPGIGTGQTIGLDILTGDFTGLGDLAGVSAYGLRSETVGDRDISIYGINESRCGLAGFFQGDVIVENRLRFNKCDIPFKVSMPGESVFAPGTSIPYPPFAVMRPSDVRPLNPPMMPGIDPTSLGGMSIFYKDLEKFYMSMDPSISVLGDGVTLLPYYEPEPDMTAPMGFSDIPVLAVLNYRDTSFVPSAKPCPECFVSVAAKNFIMIKDSTACGDPFLDVQNLQTEVGKNKSSILEQFRIIAYSSDGQKNGDIKSLDLDYTTLPNLTRVNLSQANGIDASKWMTHLTLGVKALDEEQQDLQAENEALKEQVAALEVKLDKLIALVGKTTQMESISAPQSMLQQNQPNPFHQQTTINYELPPNATSAELIIRNLQGQILKTFSLNKATTGSIILDAGSLQAGTYTYSLVVDGKMIKSKQMVLTH